MEVIFILSSLFLCVLSESSDSLDLLHERLGATGTSHVLPDSSHRKLFDKFLSNAQHVDKNEDGFVNQDEILTWLEELAKEKDLPEAEQRLMLCDINRDSRLSFDEYTRCTYGIGENQLQTNAGDVHHGIQFIHAERLRFGAVDRNVDRHLSASEFAMFLRPHNYPSVAEMESLMTMAWLDTNHDGSVTLDEFVDEKSRAHLLPGLLDSATDHFIQLDRDKDDRLSLEELRLWFNPSMYTMINNEAIKLINEIDLNGDKVLSPQEIDKAAKARSSYASGATEHSQKEV